jgi:guanine deaminase
LTRILRGRLLSFKDSPRRVGAAAFRYIEDGALRIEAGQIVEVGQARDVFARAPTQSVIEDHRGRLILPGFIDAHIHYPQTRVIGSYGEQLLEWLQKYTFVEEQKFSDPVHAASVASFFLDELARQGTTTAMVYCTVRPESADAFFEEAERRNARMIAGKVMMDRNAPPALTDDPQRGYDDSKALLSKWHGRGRLAYAISPRFAITSTPEQLEAAGSLAREFPDAHVQTHLSENASEIALTKSLFPDARDYLDVYERVGLVGPKSVFGHCIHLESREIVSLARHRGVAAFCPTSNLFLGSGLFDEAGLDAAGVRVALATDVGAGTSYSMLQTANEAYKALQLRGQSWSALQAFYQLTQGNARALGFEDRIGSLEPGREADVIVLDSRATPAMAHRMESVDGDLAEELFVLMTMGDDRAVAQTYIAGERAKAA